MSQYQKDNPDSIKSLFSVIAKDYDRANDLMSFKMHQRWNRKLVESLISKCPPQQMLDLCAGTGEITLKLLEKMKTPTEAFLLDFCPEMLECAQKKFEKNDLSLHKIHYLTADAQDIPLPGKSIDSVSVAYGIRNVKNPSQCFREVFRVLRPHGRFGILELTQPKNPLMKAGHQLYMKTVLPFIGRKVASNQEAYEYLCRSIQAFIRPSEMEDLLKAAGFQKTTVIPLHGGIATIILADVSK